MALKKNFRVGCSGYYYPAWKNIFYPEGMPPKEWLSYYSSIFNTVELNATFYRSPKITDLKKYSAITSDDFKFSVKMHKFITHNKKLLNCKDDVITYQDLILDGLKEKLACFLFQLPPSFHYNEENLERIITSVPHSPHNVVELRHISWWNEEVQQAFKKAGITFCNVDFPGMKTFIMNTAPVFYMRFHGNPVLFSSQYSLEVLTGYAEQFPGSAKENYIYFNNTNGFSAITNAYQLISLVNA